MLACTRACTKYMSQNEVPELSSECCDARHLRHDGGPGPCGQLACQQQSKRCAR